MKFKFFDFLFGWDRIMYARKQKNQNDSGGVFVGDSGGVEFGYV